MQLYAFAHFDKDFILSLYQFWWPWDDDNDEDNEVCQLLLCEFINNCQCIEQTGTVKL